MISGLSFITKNLKVIGRPISYWLMDLRIAIIYMLMNYRLSEWTNQT